MKTPCELVVGRILPSLKASVVRELSSKYNMKQSEIARKLGITQASVSQYLSATRGGGPETIECFPRITHYAKEIAKRIVDGQSRDEWLFVLCDACKEIRRNEAFHNMHKAIAGLESCDICKYI